MSAFCFDHMLLGSLGGVVTGTLADSFDWGVSYGVVAVLLGVTVVVAGFWTIKMSKGSSKPNAEA